MTSVLNFNSSSSAEFAAQDKGTTSILSNAKKLPSFIIQPPSSTNDSDLLSKRFKNSHLGDLLMKKVKSQTANTSEVNSNNQSPTAKGLKEVDDTSDNQSIQEESASPAISSFEAVEKINLIMPQRSLSTPIFSNLHLNRSADQSSQKQLLNALDTLQKRLAEYQILTLRDAILKAHLSQLNLSIPSLNTIEEKTVSPVQKIIKNLKNDEDDLEVYYGEVEYPLLHLAPKGMQVEEVNKKAKAGASNKAKGAKNKKSAKLSDCSSPSGEGDNSLLDSLTATRAGTQRSEPEMAINLRELSEQVAELLGQKNKKANKSSKNEESGKASKKTQKKEKAQRGKKGAKEEPLSPVLKSKRMTERKKNRWQQEEDELRI